MSIVEPDADLPGDSEFKPVGSAVDVVWMPDGRGLMRTMMALPEEAQAAQHHNELRYAELQKLKRGEANMYYESRYRH